MSMVQSSLRLWSIWLLPFVLLVGLIGWQTDWGREWTRTPPPAVSAVPPPVVVAVLPPYLPDATVATSRDMIDRTLFNPTRRPAPIALAEIAKTRMQKGQFALTGTLVADGKATAFLRETNGGKARRVLQGETVNGMLVAEVKADHVKFTLGDESEELGLKLAVGPRTTIQPVAMRSTTETAAVAQGLTSATSPLPGGVVRDVADVLAERRRAARDAEITAAGRPPGAALTAPPASPVSPSPQPPPVAAAPAAAGTDPAWGAVYQRYQQPRR